MAVLCIVGHKKIAKFGTGRSSQETEGYGGGPLWRRRPALGCSVSEEDEEETNFDSRCRYDLRNGFIMAKDNRVQQLSASEWFFQLSLLSKETPKYRHLRT